MTNFCRPLTNNLLTNRIPAGGPLAGHNFHRIPTTCALRLCAALLALTLLPPHASAQQVGTRDFSFGTTGIAAPTGQKPESKLWFNAGVWWGSLYNNSLQAYHIYRFDVTSQSWSDTGTQLDDRKNTSADVLWDSASGKLYVVSHITTSSGSLSTNPMNWGRLYRYTFNSATQTYVQDSGFPVLVNQGTSKTLVIAKDSLGTLWITFTQGSKVWVNNSIGGNDSTWGTPFLVPANGSDATVSSIDISSVIAFGPGKIGVLWSNEIAQKFFFAVHLDTNPTTVWQAEETALPPPTLTGAYANDHLNLKTDGTGRVFAAVKTSLTTSSSPLVMLLARSAAGAWSNFAFGNVSHRHTRPIVLLDVEHNKLFLFAAAPDSGTPQSVYYKVTDLNNISFAPGLGTPVLQSTIDLNINNPTSTKQNLTSSTGLLLLAGDGTTRFYLHNLFTLSGSPQPAITSFTPTADPAGSQVTINGSNFTGATVVAFNGRAAAFQIISDAQLLATIPNGATTGPITVANNSGLVGTSASKFTVIVAPSISSFTPASGPIGTVVTITGKGYTGTTSVTFNGVAANFKINSDTKITAAVPLGATTGPIQVTNPAGSAKSSTNFTVM